jgi:hypothetical protein
MYAPGFRGKMTSTLTLICPEGIVLATDMRITRTDPETGNILDFIDRVPKIYHVEKNNTGISYWGLAKIQSRQIIQHLKDFEKEHLDQDDSVDKTAEKLKEYLEKIAPPIKDLMGLHIAGYIKEGSAIHPRLRHVFHWSWHKPGEFTNENCHEEYHFSNGDRVLFREKRKYPALFNGDNLVANALFNYAPRIRPYYRILTNKLSLKECIELANLIINASIQRIHYFFDVRYFQKIPPTVGGGVQMAQITASEGFRWIEKGN